MSMGILGAMLPYRNNFFEGQGFMRGRSIRPSHGAPGRLARCAPSHVTFIFISAKIHDTGYSHVVVRSGMSGFSQLSHRHREMKHTNSSDSSVSSVSLRFIQFSLWVPSHVHNTA